MPFANQTITTSRNLNPTTVCTEDEDHTATVTIYPEPEDDFVAISRMVRGE